MITIKAKYWGMMFLSILTVYGTAQMLGGANMFRKLAIVASFFLPGILLFHYFFIWFPRAMAKSWSLSYLVKIIFAAVNECIMDQEIRAVVIQRMNELLKNLGFVLDQRLMVVRKNCFPRGRLSSLDPIWRCFFIEAFSTIEQEIKDETIRRWIFNKIINYLNRDANTRYAKDILRKFIGNSKYGFLVS